MKIIISRKGFDSSAAGGVVPSPIFTDNTLLSLPIPSSSTGITYNDLSFNGYLLGELVQDLTKKLPREKRIPGNHELHLDPDLNRNRVRLDPHPDLDLNHFVKSRGHPGWRPLFGQVGSARSHLDNFDVEPEDVFLFFGWFRQVVKKGGIYQYVSHTPDLHVLFGWLQIGEKKSLAGIDKNELPWASYHPHFHDPDCIKKANNKLYVASEELRLEGFSGKLPGAGIFDKYHESLCLTAPKSSNQNSSRSVWKLPKWFFPSDNKKPLSYHANAKWEIYEDHTVLHTVGRGQEFILDADPEQYHEALPWLINLIEQNA